jgi:hypothetical protein
MSSLGKLCNRGGAIFGDSNLFAARARALFGTLLLPHVVVATKLWCGDVVVCSLRMFADFSLDPWFCTAFVVYLACLLVFLLAWTLDVLARMELSLCRVQVDQCCSGACKLLVLCDRDVAAWNHWTLQA